MATKYDLCGAVVNNNIVYSKVGDPKIDTSPYEESQLEIITYIILERPAANITDGSLVPYTLAGDIRGNYAYWPKASDTFSNSLHAVTKLAITGAASAVQSQLKEHVYHPA